jgi:hypothetical protein
MKDHGISINKKCPCTQKQCPIKGNCVLCVQNHLVHKKHIPECIQNLLRPAIEELTNKIELETSEARPDKNFWHKFNKEKFLEESKNKHK